MTSMFSFEFRSVILDLPCQINGFLCRYIASATIDLYFENLTADSVEHTYYDLDPKYSVNSECSDCILTVREPLGRVQDLLLDQMIWGLCQQLLSQPQQPGVVVAGQQVEVCSSRHRKVTEW